MIPNQSQLTHRKCDVDRIVEDFAVSKKTAIRWLKHYGLWEAKENYGRKLDLKQAHRIRVEHQNGKKPKELATEFGVTYATIYRIIKYETHNPPDFASVSVVYNPHVSSSSSSGGGK